MAGERSLFGNTQEARNVYFTRVVPYLNLPGVVARFGLIPTYATNLVTLNHRYSNPTPVLPETTPDNLGYLELWVLHNSVTDKRNPLITELFHQVEHQKKSTDPLGLENILTIIYGDIPESMLTATDRSTLGLHIKKDKSTPVVTGANASGTERTLSIVTIHLSLKKQIHLVIEVEINYSGTKSKAKRKGVKSVEIYMLTQAANLTTIPDPNEVNYAHLGEMDRGFFTQTFLPAQENMAALFTVREKNKKGLLGPYIGLFRVVIS
jgi:hypothetical protein